MPDTATNLNNLVQGLVMLTMGIILFLKREEFINKALRSEEVFWNIKYTGNEPGMWFKKFIGKFVIYSISFVFVVGGFSFVWTACRNLIR